MSEATTARNEIQPPPVTLRIVYSAWWPLATSWLLMGLEVPLVSAVMARLRDPVVSLAAYGGVVFPLALMIEAPIIMLLTASTALSRDEPSYRLVRRYMFSAALTLTALHAVLAFTPLFYVVVAGWMHAPPEILEPSRRGLQILLPWTLSIAYRRFQQGALIRFGRSRIVGIGTGVRLAATAGVLGFGAMATDWPGIVIGTLAVAAGVVSEAICAGLAVRPVLRELREAPLVAEPLTPRAFARFYLPLAVMPILMFIAMPLASAAMGRMPRTVESLAAWPVLNGFVFTLRSAGFSLSEVVVSLLDRPGAVTALRRFTTLLAGSVTVVILAFAITPLGRVWFAQVSALQPSLVSLAVVGLLLAVPMPGLSTFQSWYQGAVVHGRRTRAITESMVVYVIVIAATLAIGVLTARLPGLPVAIVALVLGNLAQVLWLRMQAHAAIRAIELRDGAVTPERAPRAPRATAASRRG